MVPPVLPVVPVMRFDPVASVTGVGERLLFDRSPLPDSL